MRVKNVDITIYKKSTAEMQKLEDDFEKKKSKTSLRAVPLPCENDHASKKNESLMILELLDLLVLKPRIN